MEFLTLAEIGEVPSGEARRFRAASLEVLLTRVGDLIFALQARCPHRGCDWDGARVEGEIVPCPRCRYRYSARTGLNPLTTSCHVNQSTAECHYRNFPEGKADVHDVRLTAGRVEVAVTPRPFRKILV